MLCIVGVGNTLLKDDGAGVRVVEDLSRSALPPGVLVLDAGTAILKMLPELVKASRIIIVDAIRAGAAPGSLHYFEGAAGVPRALSRSVHDFSFDEVLAELRLLGCTPDVEYVGIEPKEITYGLELSEEVSKSVPALVGYLLDRIARWAEQRDGAAPASSGQTAAPEGKR
jgi:hydrogenase maturation protease